MRITIEKNGYEVLPDVLVNKVKWSDYLLSKLGSQLLEIAYFNYSENIVFAFVRLNNGDCAEYIITSELIRFVEFDKHVTFEHYLIFMKAQTKNIYIGGEIE